MNIITNSTQDRFLKIKRMLNNTEDIGKSTLVELSNQGEQLKNINSKSNNLYEQLTITKSKLHNIISSISSISILNIPFSNLNVMKEPLNATNATNNAINPHNTIKSIDFDGNEQLDEISNKLKKLKLIALDINGEIIQQNSILDKISINIDKSNDITTENNNNIIKLINK